MKSLLFLIIGLSFLFYGTTGSCTNAMDDQQGVPFTTSAETILHLVSSPELNSLAMRWAFEYGRLNRSVKIAIDPESDDQAKADLSFIANEFSEARNDGGSWKMVIGRDAVVAVVNAKNPLLEKINGQGLSAGELAQLFSNPEKMNWKSMISGGADAPIHLYMIENGGVNASLGKYTNIDNAALVGAMAATHAALVLAVQKDVYAIGFCKLTDVRDASTNELVQGISLLPIDKNSNGRVDSFENIYASIDAFTRGVWIGKYPNALCGNIYAVASAKPTDKNTVAFLTWITTYGQLYLNPTGYSHLANREVRSNLEALTGTEVTIAQTGRKPIVSGVWLAILIVLGIAVLTLTPVFMYFRKQKSDNPMKDLDLIPVLNEDTILVPKGLYFDKTHTWAFMEADGNVKVGVDDFLQHITGSLTRIAMKQPGEIVRKGEKILTIVRDGKQLNIYAPISGMIREQNKSLLADSSLINTSPFSEGWVYVIEPKNWMREIQFMLMGEKYKDWLSDEFSRLKDFFAASVRSNTAVYAHIVLQDGGELTDNVLADLGPEVWEDFQTKFIDTSK